MATKYSIKQLKEMYERANTIFDDTAAHYDAMIYDQWNMYDLRQNMKSVHAYGRRFKELAEAGKPYVDQYDELVPSLEFMVKIQKRVKNYHKKNIKKDLLMIEEKTAEAQKICASVVDKWLPKLKTTQKAKDWKRAAEIVLDMPYQVGQYKKSISFGAIRDEGTITTIKGLDTQVKKILDKVPAKSYKAAVISRQQVKMDTARENINNLLEAFQKKVAAKPHFDPEKFHSHDFARNHLQKLEEAFKNADRISFETSDLLRDRELPFVAER